MRFARPPRHAAPKARSRRAHAASPRRSQALTAASLVLALVGALILSAKAVIPARSGRGTPAAAWPGARPQGDSGILASQQATTLQLEATIGPEPEDHTVAAPAMIASDASASGGKYVEFGDTRNPTTIGTPIPASYFGMHTQSLSHWPSVTFASLGKGTMVNWPYIEQTKDVFNWSELDKWVAQAQAQGKDFFYSNNGVPPWASKNLKSCSPYSWAPSIVACTSGVSDMAGWEKFVTLLATRYKGKLIYELWNEPDDYPMADMVAMTNREAQIIRQIDPGAIILSPSAYVTYMDKYFAAGGTTAVDAGTTHAYGTVAESDVNQLVSMRNVMNKYGMNDKPLWDTESSWGTGQPDDQVAFLARDYLLHWSMGSTRFYWYSWDNGSFGLMWTSSTGPLLPTMSYTQVQKWMVGATMTSQCRKGTDGTTWTCPLTRPGGYQALAVWNTAGFKGYTPATQYIKYRNLVGGSTAVSPGQTITIGKRPILLENMSPTTAVDYGSVAGTANVPVTATYRVWSRIMAPDAPNNSYTLELGGKSFVVGDVTIPASQWVWVDYAAGNISAKTDVALTSGRVPFKLAGRERGVKLDRVVITPDLTCVPTGTGDNCATEASLSPSPPATSTPSPTTSPTPTPTPTPTPSPSPTPAPSNGLTGTYYDWLGFSGPSATRVDSTVNFDWGTGAPLSAMGRDKFSVRWTGRVQAPVTGKYRFCTVSDDGARLWVNGKKLVDNWTDHDATRNCGNIGLTSRQRYSLKIEYYEDLDSAVAQLLWARPGRSLQIVPQSSLYTQ